MSRTLRQYLWVVTTLLAFVVVATVVAAYILDHQRLRWPWEQVMRIEVELESGQAVSPGQGQQVLISGVEVGEIGAVRLEDGRAVVRLDIDPQRSGPLYRDATFLLRPKTALNDMSIAVDPGRPAAGRIRDGDRLPVANSQVNVNPDEVLSALDADTRSYLQLLINGLGKGFDRRGKDLNATFKALAPTQRDLRRVSEAIASRKRELKRLINNYGNLTNTLADRDNDVRRLIDASNATLSAFAQENENIATAVARLPGALRETESTLTKVDAFSDVLRPALNSLRPAFRQLDVANREVLPFVREAEPITRRQIRPFVRIARPYVRDLRPAAANLSRAAPDLSDSLYELNRFFNMVAYNPKGREALPNNLAAARARDEGYLFWVGWVAQNTVSIFSTADSQGPFRRAYFGTTCDLVREEVAHTPAAGVLLGFNELLAPTGLCGGGGTNP